MRVFTNRIIEKADAAPGAVRRASGELHTAMFSAAQCNEFPLFSQHERSVNTTKSKTETLTRAHTHHQQEKQTNTTSKKKENPAALSLVRATKEYTPHQKPTESTSVAKARVPTQAERSCPYLLAVPRPEREVTHLRVPFVGQQARSSLCCGLLVVLTSGCNGRFGRVGPWGVDVLTAVVEWTRPRNGKANNRPIARNRRLRCHQRQRGN